jgi:hypothetical protein
LPIHTPFRLCPVCGRDDRKRPLGVKRHVSNGKPCPGTPIVMEHKGTVYIRWDE